MINIIYWIFLFIAYMEAIWRSSNAVIYIVPLLSTFTDLKLERIGGPPYLRI